MHAYINGVSKDVFRDDSRRKSILARLAEREFTDWSSLGGQELSVDEVVESQVQLLRCAGQRAALGETDWDEGVQESETRRQDAAMRLREQHGYTATEAGQLVAL